MPTSIKSLLQQSAQQIDSDSAMLDAELLLCEALDKPRSYLMAWSDKTPSEAEQASFDALLQRRIKGEPIAHILQQQEFWSLPFKVTPDTLIPRADTELLVETTLALLPATPHSIADLGTGSGCIAIALKTERPGWQVTAVDKSPDALEVARHNATLNKVDIRFIESSWCDALQDTHYDLIVSNPPYIRNHDEHLSQGDVRFEPITALTAGDDGLDDIRLICQQAAAKLKPGGYLLFEFGYDQAEAVCAIMQAAGFSNIITYQDLAGITRAASGQY